MAIQPSMDDKFLTLVYRIINENLEDENFSVEELALKVGLSRSMLHRKLVKLTGKSATNLITDLRLNRARELLENNVATVSEIAYKVGFNSTSYFHRVFKKNYKVSPGDFKKSSNSRIKNKPDNISGIEIIAKKKTSFLKITASIVLIAIILSIPVFYIISDHQKRSQNSIAVLPIQNLTGQKENIYFADGVHDALIGELGRISSLRVISRTSTQRYRQTTLNLRDIAKELGVNSIVEGSVFCSGDSICLLIQLIDVYPEERHLLTTEYYDDMHNVLTVQSTAVKDIAQNIRIRLTRGEKELLGKSRKINPETYKIYLKGMYYMNQGTEFSFQKGIDCFQEAIDRDPGDPFAYAGLAISYATKAHGQFETEESFQRALSCAKKAIAIDSSIDQAHTALALLYQYYFSDWPNARNAFEKALSLNPNNVEANFHFGWYYALFNDAEKAIYYDRKAIEIEPFSANNSCHLALLYYKNNEYEKAEYWAKRSLDLQENIPYGNVAMSWICLKRKQYQKAIEYIENLPEKYMYFKILRGYTYVMSGHREKALKYWNEFEDYSEDIEVNTCYTGMMAAYLGFTDTAFELLNHAWDNKYFPIAFINFYPLTESLRSDPRYNLLLDRMNLPPV